MSFTHQRHSHSLWRVFIRLFCVSLLRVSLGSNWNSNILPLFSACHDYVLSYVSRSLFFPPACVSCSFDTHKTPRFLIKFSSAGWWWWGKTRRERKRGNSYGENPWISICFKRERASERKKKLIFHSTEQNINATWSTR